MNIKSLEDLDPLLPESTTSGSLEKEYSSSVEPRRRGLCCRIPLMALLAVSVLLNVALVVRQMYPGRRFASDQKLYSPVQDILKYETRVFLHTSDTSMYHGPPSDAVDQAWQDLYSFGVSRIPKSQAALMVNRTIAIPGDEGNYVLILNVFHLLHCLNKLRQALYPDYYPHYGVKGIDHIEHCLNSIRQSLMCSVDVTPIVFQWDEKEQRSFVRTDTLHSCRNFENIRGWAKEHQLYGEVITTVHVEDDLD